MNLRPWRPLCGLTTLLILIVSLPAAPAPATKAPRDAWPLFRGDPAQTGVASATLPDKLEELWTFSAKDSIEGAVAIANGVVYLGSYDEHLYALDLATGAEKWKVKIGPIKAAPSVRDGKVYVGTVDGLFVCLDAANGGKAWDFTSGGEITSGANFFEDRVLFASHDEHLYCLDRNGKRLWDFKTDGPMYGTPAVVEGRTFMAACDSILHVIDIKTGKQEAAVNLSGQSGATAAVRGDQLYVGNMNNEFQAIDWKAGKVAWTFKAARRPDAFFASAAVNDKLVIVGSRDNCVHALDRKTGTSSWTVRTRNKVDSSPVIDGDRVYAASADGKLYVLDLASGRELHKITLDDAVLASPAVAGGRLLIGTQKGTLYCFGKK